MEMTPAGDPGASQWLATDTGLSASFAPRRTRGSRVLEKGDEEAGVLTPE